MVELKFLNENSELVCDIEIPSNEFMRIIDDGNHLVHHDETDGSLIRIPYGTWDIMDSLIPKILKYRFGDIVEIGMGESTTIFADYAYEEGAKLHSCDIQMGGMFKVFDRPLFENHICYIMKSEDFIKKYDGTPSIVFLDGEHNYKAVKREVDFFLPRLVPGGVMFLHDTMPPYKRQTKVHEKGFSPGDVYKMRHELERMPEVDVFTWPYSAADMGLTMVMKHDEDRPYWRGNGRIEKIC